MLPTMPKQTDDELVHRGGAIRWRTITLADGRKALVAVTRSPGPRGGKTMLVHILPHRHRD